MKKCEIFGTGVGHGHLISHSHRLTNRVWKPNLQSTIITVKGQKLKVTVTAKTLKTIKGKSEAELEKILRNSKDLSPRIAKVLFS